MPRLKITILLILSLAGLTRLTVQAQIPHVSLQKIDSLTAIVADMPDDTVKAYTLAMICSNHSNADSTLKYAQELYSLSFKLGPKWQAMAYRYFSWYYNMNSDFENSMKYLYKALKINDSLNIKYEMAMNYNALGENVLNLGDYSTANKYLHSALDILIELNNTRLITYTYRDLAIIYINYKLFEQAARYLNEAMKIDSANNNLQQIAMDYYYMAETKLSIFNEKNDTAALFTAKDLSIKSNKLFKETNSDFHITLSDLCCMQVYAYLADIQEQLDKRKQLLDSCMIYYNEAYAAAEQQGMLEGFSFQLELCRTIYLFINEQYKECKKVLSDLEAKVEEDPANYKGYLLDIYLNFTELYERTGDYKKAFEYQAKMTTVERQYLDYEFAANSIKLNAKDEFESEMRQRHIEENKLKLSISEQKKRMRTISIIASTTLFLLLMLALDIYRHSRRRQNINMQLYRQRENYRLQRDMLANANQQVTSSIMYAKEIQTAIIPSDKLMNSLFGDHLLIWKPMKIVSGDFYWAAKFGRLKVLAVGDCTGHGVPGAFMSMLGITTLNDIVSTSDLETTTAAEILDNMNFKILNSLRKSEQLSAKFDGMDIALCIIDTENHKMQYAGGFRQLVIIRGGAMIDYSPDQMAVGFNRSTEQKFTNNRIDLQDGDTIYLYTNGLSNQFSNEDRGTRFSDERLNKLLRANSSKPFAEQKLIIEEALTRWTTSNLGEVCPQTDDQVLIGIKI